MIATRTRMRNVAALGGLAGVIALSAVPSRLATAHERYNDGCAECHGSFFDGTSPQGTEFPGGSKHTMHANIMRAQCSLCHRIDDDGNPYIGQSDGTPQNPPVGCIGCHGRDYGGAIGVSGIGLRAHHAQSGVDQCGTCHTDDALPLPENVVPPYYGTADTACDDPCNFAPETLENWSVGDTRGLDNDGDCVYDERDSNCGAGGLDLEAYRRFAQCMHGPEVPYESDGAGTLDASTGPGVSVPCAEFDYDADGDVDLEDFAEFTVQFTGP